MFRRKDNKKGLSDEDLLQLYKDTHDNEYLGGLYSRYMPFVYGCCLKNSENARDAVMFLFEDLLKKTLVHTIDDFKARLYTLTRNHCLMQLRSTSKNKSASFNDTFMEFTDDLHLDSILEDERKIHAQEDCVEKLPEEQRKGMVHFYLEERSYKEICQEICEETLSVISKVKSYIQNGKHTLKLCLERKGMAEWRNSAECMECME